MVENFSQTPLYCTKVYGITFCNPFLAAAVNGRDEVTDVPEGIVGVVNRHKDLHHLLISKPLGLFPDFVTVRL